jgi:hypothetical protein
MNLTIEEMQLLIEAIDTWFVTALETLRIGKILPAEARSMLNAKMRLMGALQSRLTRALAPLLEAERRKLKEEGRVEIHPA